MTQYPDVPTGSGRHPIPLVSISSRDLAGSAAFYERIFGWQLHGARTDVTGAATPAGPNVLLATPPAGVPAMVPFIRVPDVQAMLDRIVASGGIVEGPRWDVPGTGTLARFADPSGTLYGLMGSAPGPLPAIPVPFGSNPTPPAATICSLEMYSKDHTVTARFFNEVFEWGTRETMPQYLGFNPGAGIGGVFQSHTPSLPALAYVYVPEVATTLREIEAAGGSRAAEPMSAPGLATFGYFTDPSGTQMGLIGG